MMHRCGQEVTDPAAHVCPGRVIPAGRTVAEAVGLAVPANAPGGARLPSPTTFQRHSGAERASRHADVLYDGFVDRDAWT